MLQSSTTKHSVRFAVFEVDLESGELRKHGVKIKLQQKPFQILSVLLERPGEVVTREELQKRLWSSDVFVDFESGLNNAVKKLRAALSDSAETPRFIETVARHGYRFLANPQYGDISHTASLPPQAAQKTKSLWLWIAAALALIALLGAVLVVRQRKTQPSPVASQVRKIAVLPLENLSHDEQQEFFADGMTDAIIDQLARVQGLTVISRTSTIQYKKARKPLPQIARELGVDTVVEGTILRSGNRVRVSAQLIDAATDRHLLSRTFEQEMEDILKLQQDVARAVAQQIKSSLTAEDAGRLSRPMTVAPEAYKAFLLGRFYWFKRTQDGFWRSIEYFQQAIAREPNYAMAYMGLADAYFSLQNSEIVPPLQFKAQERAAILKALALDDSLAEAHTSLAHAQEMEDWDFAAAEKEYRRAVELNPNYALAHQWLGNDLAIRGRSEEAVEESRKAMALDPLLALYRASYAHRIAYARRFDEAAAECNKALELDANHPTAHVYLGQIEEYRGLFSNAIIHFRKAYESSGAPLHLANLGHAYARSGNHEEALSILARLQALSKTRYVSPYAIALVYIGLADKEKAFVWLQKAVTERSPTLTTLKIDPVFDELRGDPRFGSLLSQIGL
ncbi:MAG TPA: winged helix-turn-helix domain-containing protein [Bryobacteraceae bacterium]|jgi:TolB-like protein/DNA-binding winged helix-turn-helix (wHTH) protein|nr:winged helix-turn-helix domain-containing protein [Bryobacteraceae bacterium]